MGYGDQGFSRRRGAFLGTPSQSYNMLEHGSPYCMHEDYQMSWFRVPVVVLLLILRLYHSSYICSCVGMARPTYKAKVSPKGKPQYLSLVHFPDLPYRGHKATVYEQRRTEPKGPFLPSCMSQTTLRLPEFL